MKKRSMLAIASLATGFVVAAITPSHGLDAVDSLGQTDALSKLDVEGTLGKVGKVGKKVSGDTLAVDPDALGGKAGQDGQKGKGAKEG